MDDLRDIPGSWSSQVVLDCEWASKQWGLALPQDLSGCFLAWVKAAASLSKWPDRCKTLWKYAKRNLCATHELRLWHVSLCEAFKMSAIPIPDWLCGPVLALSELVCHECGAIFASRTALAVHSRILHGSVNDADQRVREWWEPFVSDVESSSTLGRVWSPIYNADMQIVSQRIWTMCHLWT